MKKWYIIILAIILVVGAGYLFMYKIPANKADQAISEFVKKENKNNAKIKESKLYKNWKLGGFYKFVDYSDDKIIPINISMIQVQRNGKTIFL
ncbi:Protein of uncharacterised function (DUF3139) [Listeria grayi]|uniref:Protein of uncharacterized function (DUF3139) n=1 Tax=Listeria grayi TaxID=1641 RepID=A0A378MH85_LISGR|nr:DUF3139 domain-containing protein [Listeria grayi]STY44742.1 Protein of uncharacterised function (DUF3139) [Listeria grayi]